MASASKQKKSKISHISQSWDKTTYKNTRGTNYGN